MKINELISLLGELKAEHGGYIEVVKCTCCDTYIFDGSVYFTESVEVPDDESTSSYARKEIKAICI